MRGIKAMHLYLHMNETGSGGKKGGGRNLCY